MSQHRAGDRPSLGTRRRARAVGRPAIECLFAGRGLSFVVELASEEAPSSVAALLERLPVDGDTYHTKWCGREFCVVLPPFDAPASERPTAEVRIGDVVVVHRDATDRTAPWRLRAAGLGAYVELGFFYGDGCRLFGPTGTVPGTRVGRIVGDLTALSRAVGEMRKSGFERLTARRRA
ncbi:MAG TPA: DUF3830 family protein [Chloroflexota bacterium]|jgi:hypothetical protein